MPSLCTKIIINLCLLYIFYYNIKEVHIGNEQPTYRLRSSKMNPRNDLYRNW